MGVAIAVDAEQLLEEALREVAFGVGEPHAPDGIAPDARALCGPRHRVRRIGGAQSTSAKVAGAERLRSAFAAAAQRIESLHPAARRAALRRLHAAARPCIDASALFASAALGVATANAPRSPFDDFVNASNAWSAQRARRLFFVRELLRRYRAADPTRAFRVLAVGADAAGDVAAFVDAVGPAAPVETVLAVAATQAEARRGFDFALCPRLLDFASDGDATAALEASFRALRPGGSLLAAHYLRDLTPADRLLLELWRPGAARFRTPRELARILSRLSRGDGARGAHGSVAGLVRGPNVYLSVECRSIAAQPGAPDQGA